MECTEATNLLVIQSTLTAVDDTGAVRRFSMVKERLFAASMALYLENDLSKWKEVTGAYLNLAISFRGRPTTASGIFRFTSNKAERTVTTDHCSYSVYFMQSWVSKKQGVHFLSKLNTFIPLIKFEARFSHA